MMIFSISLAPDVCGTTMMISNTYLLCICRNELIDVREFRFDDTT